MKHKDNFIPLNLQFFAEDDPKPQDNPAPKDDPKPNNDPAPKDDPPEVTVESLMAEVAALKAQAAKQKTEYDKLCTSEGNLRKQLRAKQTAEEQEAEAKAEQEAQRNEYIKSLERFKAVSEATDRYVSMSMPLDLAKATAEAEVDGNKDTVTENINKFLKEQKEVMDKEIHAKYASQMPLPQSGNNSQVDYSAEINKARDEGDMQGMALAILNQAQAVMPVPQ